MTNRKNNSSIIWNPDLSQYPGPKYRALADAIEQAISTGTLKSGDQLPTHRALADSLSVTIGTITRGYAEAERRRLVVARVGSGTFIQGKVWEKRDFSIPEGSDNHLIDLSLSLTVPARREQLLAETLSNLVTERERLTATLCYHPEHGLQRHREAIVRWLRYHGMEASADHILITSGGQHANTLALQGLLRPDDTVLSDELTYPGFINATRQLQLRHLGVAIDQHGMIPQALERCCEQYRPRLLYLMPNLQNPTASVMPLERRQAIIAIARQFNMIILEDDVQFITPEHRLPSLYTLAPEQVIYSGSFSKHLAAGLRVGFSICPQDLIGKMTMALRSHCWVCPPLTAEIACDWIDSGTAWQLIAWQREEIEQRQRLLQDILGNFELQSQPYSFHAWLKLPEPWRAETFVQQLLAGGVRVLPSEIFAVGGVPVPQAIRLCISTPNNREQLASALKTIKKTLKAEPVHPISPLVF